MRVSRTTTLNLKQEPKQSRNPLLGLLVDGPCEPFVAVHHSSQAQFTSCCSAAGWWPPSALPWWLPTSCYPRGNPEAVAGRKQSRQLLARMIGESARNKKNQEELPIK
jgi:hypothetical protein